MGVNDSLDPVMTRPPILSVSSADLARQPVLVDGDRIVCPACGQTHSLWPALGQTVNPSIWIYSCDAHLKTGGIDGRLVPGLELATSEGAPTEGKQ